MIRFNPDGEYPQIAETAYIDQTAVIIGQVQIGEHVFVAPGVILRADEKDSSIIINDNCNIQDRVIIHALAHTSVVIEQNVSLTHGCIIHGPCLIRENSFIGFGSVLFDTEVGKDVFIKHLAVVEGISILPEKVIGSCVIVDNEDRVQNLKDLDESLRKFADTVRQTNLDLVKKYKGLKGY